MVLRIALKKQVLSLSSVSVPVGVWGGGTSVVRSIMFPSVGREATFWPRLLTSSTTSPTPTAPTPLASLSSALISLRRLSVQEGGMVVWANISWAMNRSSRIDNVRDNF